MLKRKSCEAVRMLKRASKLENVETKCITKAGSLYKSPPRNK